MKSVKTLLVIGLCLSAALFLAACDGGGSSSSGGGSSAGSPAAGYGTLRVHLTDAPNNEYKAVFVSISSVAVHMADSEEWVTVATPQVTQDLLELLGGVTAMLGEANLAAGRYTQVRLMLSPTPFGSHPFGNYVIDMSDQAQELKVPSGFSSGIKLTHGFTVPDGGTITLLIDFDAAKSVKKTGANQWQLKPTIKVSDVPSS